MTPPLPGPGNSVAERCDMTDAKYLQSFTPRLHQWGRLRLSLTHKTVPSLMWAAALLALVVVLGAARCVGQAQAPAQSSSDPAPQNAALQELQSQVRELKQLVLQLQQQTVDSHTEITKLREELETRGNGPGGETGGQQASSYLGSGSDQMGQRLDHIEEDQQLLSDKVDDQYQTKLESASKYRIRFSGIVLFNLFGNSGSVENQDVPTWAIRPYPSDSSGSVGGTMRQSILGFETFGPDLLGAHTSANVNFDFGGGFPATYNGVDRDWCGCAPPPYAWTGRILPSSQARINSSCRPSHRHRSPRSSFQHYRTRAICGHGRHSCVSSIALPCRAIRPSRSKAHSWIL